MKKNMMKQMKGDKWPAFSQGFMVVTTSLLFPTMLCVGGFFQQADIGQESAIFSTLRY